ncbi:MAG TPA: HAD-IG family 5'-nucleotidase [Gemmatimonadales bacterium]|nr:HAD-IG family 5'-nucleotidase [Gemmatimonadales bacterium]
MSTAHPPFPRPPRARGIFCNRTLNLRSVRAIGYDMDYTLIHYRVREWEQRAFEHLRRKLAERGWPVKDLAFDSTQVMRGLILDTELGNIVKANRFGYVKRAAHGTRVLDFDRQREVYARVQVDLAEPRYVFLNTLFTLSEASMYAQLVDLLDSGKLPGVLGYGDLYRQVRASLDEAHVEGELKAEILADPDRFVEADPEAPLALLDQRRSGKKLLLITNSEWPYTQALMGHAFDQYLPSGTTWRDLFNYVIVAARKPAFFEQDGPVFEIADPAGLLRPARNLAEGGLYFGGNAALVEEALGVSGDQILYVGDHLFSDVHVSKNVVRWRTALVLRELEAELDALEAARAQQEQLAALMQAKERLEFDHAQLRVALQRKRGGYGPAPQGSAGALERQANEVRTQLTDLDNLIAPLAEQSATTSNPHWGLLMRTGNDKSYLARQVERYADVYMSRVSNFLYQTPFVYLRSPRGSLPHDPDYVFVEREED